MATKTKVKFPFAATGRRKGDILTGSITLGGSGAISSAAGYLPVTTTAGAFGVIKTSAKTARYSLKFERKWKSLRIIGLAIFGPADAAFGNTNANAVQARNAALDGFDIQLFLASSGVDTDGASGYRIDWAVEVGEY